MKWWTKSWNPVTGCDPVSEACEHCYAKRMARRLAGRHGYPADGDYFKVTLHANRLLDPFKKWTGRHRVFVGNMGDIFHPAVPDSFLDEIFFSAYTLDQHAWFFCTKRIERAADYLKKKSGLLSNVWIGTTVENQNRLDERAYHLFRIPGNIRRFLSIEPLLGPVDLKSVKDGSWHDREGATRYDALRGAPWWGHNGDPGLGGGPKIDWVIAGGETGPGARFMDPAWAYELEAQCRSAGIPFFFKQNYGGYPIPALLDVHQIPGESG